MKPIFIFSSLVILFSSCSKPESASNASSSGQATSKPYPLDSCLVSGEELGSMGDPVVITHEGQDIKFCCDSCIPKFEKDPAKYLSKLGE
ncbi:hypothetical protein [Haloferula sp.]|uniref:hypothetical protein n=1 Tax=Haloferula sp. TaxID=2497595 RepID=UPI003C72705E